MAIYYTKKYEAVVDQPYIKKVANLYHGGFLPYKKSNVQGFDVIMVMDDELKNIYEESPGAMIIVNYKDKVSSTSLSYAKNMIGKNIVAYININDNIESYEGVFSNIKIPQISEASIEKTALQELYSKSLNELERVKKIHKSVVPLRQDKFPNISICSKFQAGTEPGGEFFDAVECGDFLVVLSCSFRSYLGMSVAIKNLDLLKQTKKISQSFLEDFIETFLNDCREIEIVDRDDYRSFQLDLLAVNLKTLESHYYHFGDSMLVSSLGKKVPSNEFIVNENNFERAQTSFLMERGERFYYLSSGFSQNMKDQFDSLDFDTLNQIPKEEVVHEVMYHVKKDISGVFLKVDASTIVIEVNKNAMVKV